MLLVVLVVLSSTREFFTHIETSTITGEGLQILINDRHLWPLSSEGSLACHTYCDTGQPFIMVLRGSVTLAPYAERLAVELSLPVLTT